MSPAPAADLERALRARLPAAVRLAVAPVPEDASALHPEEARLVERAVEKRRSEFAGGRRLARGLLAELGHADAPLLRRADRSAAWPAGAVGTISHSERVCAAAVAPSPPVRALGLDLQRERSLSERLARRVMPELSAGASTRAVLRGFCAKEATYKAFSGFAGRVFGFEDVVLAPDGDGFAARAVDARLRDDLAPHLGLDPRWRVDALTLDGWVAAWVVLLEG